MKKKYIAGAFVCLAGAFAIYKWHTSAASADAASVYVQTAKVKSMALPLEVNAIGSLVAQSVEVTPEVAGHIQSILFQDGADVKQGQVLIQLDDAVYQAKLASAKAKLAYSENNYKRMVLLGKQGAVTKQAIDQADADLKECQADAKESEVMLSKMRLTAPFDGVVAKAKVSPGDYVNIGQGLVTLTDTQHLHVEFNLPDNYLSNLKLGEEVRIKTSAYPDKTFVGKVAYISPTVSPDNRSVALYAEIPNQQKLLDAGMFVDVTQSLGKLQQALMIPSRSLVPALEGEQVYKITDGKAYIVNVKIGVRAGDNVQITQGLAVNDEVVTDGQLKLKNGLPIQITS